MIAGEIKSKVNSSPQIDALIDALIDELLARIIHRVFIDQPKGVSPMPLTLAPQEPFLVAEWRKPPGFLRVFSHNTGRLAPYRYQSQHHWANALRLMNNPG